METTICSGPFGNSPNGCLFGASRLPTVRLDARASAAPARLATNANAKLAANALRKDKHPASADRGEIGFSFVEFAKLLSCPPECLPELVQTFDTL
jgi:hypothetical protein